MKPDEKSDHDWLKRLPATFYRGKAFVHWSMTIAGRKQGWLDATFHARFREALVHTVFRYGLACPIYCCMPDHLHLLLMGLWEGADQRNAMKFLRKHTNSLLERLNLSLQKQPYDHVLKDEERQDEGFAAVFEYLSRNPERAGLVPQDGYRQYPYTGCVVPGYPELELWQPDFWTRFWRIHAYLIKHGLQSEAPSNS